MKNIIFVKEINMEECENCKQKEYKKSKSIIKFDFNRKSGIINLELNKMNTK